ncbi:MAG: hypothetical protein Q8O89_05830 [Nanoarchaeota archaeon]|nr:hypothetical protein [Nanoarchaeota archaeon]
MSLYELLKITKEKLILTGFTSLAAILFMLFAPFLGYRTAFLNMDVSMQILIIILAFILNIILYYPFSCGIFYLIRRFYYKLADAPEKKSEEEIEDEIINKINKDEDDEENKNGYLEKVAEKKSKLTYKDKHKTKHESKHRAEKIARNSTKRESKKQNQINASSFNLTVAILFILVLNPIAIGGYLGLMKYLNNTYMYQPCGVKIVAFADLSPARDSGLNINDTIILATRPGYKEQYKINTGKNLADFLAGVPVTELILLSTSAETYTIQTAENPKTNLAMVGFDGQDMFCRK